MDYKGYKHVSSIGDVPNCFMIPHGIVDFESMGTLVERDGSGKHLLVFHGDLFNSGRMQCPNCKENMHINNTFACALRHLPFGSTLSFIRFTRKQYFCPCCGATKMEEVSFRAKHHRITKLLERYAEELLASGYTNKEVSGITGIGQGVVKAIDKDRLRREYTERKEEGRQAVLTLRRPKEYARQLGIDEFKLHKGNRFATHIIDMETGHILWIGHGKRKQIVYDFIEHVGEEWMSHVEAVACDMNSDYEEAFEERCEWIQPVFDYFHIVKTSTKMWLMKSERMSKDVWKKERITQVHRRLRKRSIY